jgi:hypothetical protein
MHGMISTYSCRIKFKKWTYTIGYEGQGVLSRTCIAIAHNFPAATRSFDAQEDLLSAKSRHIVEIDAGLQVWAVLHAIKTGRGGGKEGCCGCAPACSRGLLSPRQI